jgi:hypothetical protein
MIEQSWANEFAEEWIAAWNSHGLDPRAGTASVRA